MDIDFGEERATVAQALHEDADALEEEAAMLDSVQRINEASRARVRANFLREAAVYLLRSSTPSLVPAAPPPTEV